ncbi:SpoIIE family protein phosphatase [Pseudonocardia acidicola]|uniref:histidine kinase n=1 Tax=Pseudonocardia acidicola TaxID=2724939 RepID=A0ABX1SIS1_9PSEU|nr:SpoIIE family protein phosphatase [Pseudonocardia acidicola]NMI00393.1 SpoIIE family protein phosphatase [Pseudonocardia acidicola]
MSGPTAAVDAQGPAGSIRRLIAETDWSGTALGPIEQWPTELRTAVDIMLGSRHPLVLCWGPEFAFLYNDAFVAGAGTKHPAGFGQPCEQVWPEIWDTIGPLLAQVYTTGEPVFRDDDLLVMHRNGFPEETYWRYSYGPIRGPDGRVLGILNVTSETTGQVVGERRLRLLGRLAGIAHEVRSVEEALREVGAVLENARPDVPCALLYTYAGAVGGPDDGALRLVASAGLAESPEGFVPPQAGAAPDIIDAPPEMPAARTEHPVRQIAVAVLPGGDGWPSAPLVLGVPPWLRVDEDYRAFLRLVVGHIGTAVSAARAHDAERRRAETLAALDRAKTEFFTGVSHEFRTPLALILGPLEQLRTTAAPDVRADLEVAHRNAQRMLKLVNSLLDVSQLEAGRTETTFVPVDLGSATAELAGLFRSATERAGLRLDVDCPPSTRPVWVDRDMWEKIVLNLLSNAVKFTFTGGITVSLRTEGEQAVLRMADTGTGIPAEDLPRLFERFHRVRGARARSHEGSGIGLTLVRQLVELHGGTVEVTSTPDVGSTFTVRLPMGIAHLPVEAMGSANAAPAVRPAAGVEPFLAEALRWMPGDPDLPLDPAGTTPLPDGPGHRDRVLVADDNPDMRDYLERLLSQHWTVQTVASGTQALEAALADPPDLVVADVMMPGLDGIGLLRALRTDARTAGLPVVLLSARAGEEAAVEGLAAGADDYLVKPFSARELLARVANHLQLGRTRRAAELRFRAMADSTPALIWVDDAGGHRVFVNRGWLDFTGVTDPAAELGTDWRDRIHPEDRDRYHTVTAAAARRGAPFEVEYRLRSRDGRYRWVLDRGAPVGGGDRPAGYVGGCLDIDARHREQRRHRIYAGLGDALDAELTADGRLRALARLLVAEGLADMVRVHDGASEEDLVLRAVAAVDPALESVLWRLDGASELRGQVMQTREARLFGLAELTATLTGSDPGQHASWQRLDAHSMVAAPLVARGGLLGVVLLARTTGSPPYNDEDLELVAEIARRAGVALDNTRLLELERAAAQRLGMLHRATAEMSAAATPNEVARIAAQHLVTLLDAPIVGVWELRDGSLEVLTGQGWSLSAQRSWSSVSLDVSRPARDVVRTRTALWFENAGEWRHRFPDLETSVSPMALAALGLLPLMVGERCLGVLGVAFREARTISASDREAAVAVAELAAQALDRSYLLVAETEGRRVAERLGAVATSLSRATDLDSVAAVIVAHGLSAVEAEAVVVLLAGDGGALYPLAAEGWAAGSTDLPESFADAAHPLARAVRSGEPVWQAAPGPPESGGAYPVHTAVPLLVGGRPIGALGFRFAGRPLFSPERRSFVLTLASQCAQAVMRARLHQAEHEVAVTLQRSLLPQRMPDLDRLALATRYLPGTEGTEAGGDWFDVLELADGQVALVVGDVVGRGPSAAAVMGQLRSALAANLVNGQSPAAALEQLDLFALRIDGAMASTVACAVVDCETGELRYACAGHPPPLVAGPDGVRLLMQGRGTPLGVAGRPPFVEAVDRIEPGSTILLCSDGLFERRTEVIDDGLDRLIDAFGALAHGRPEDTADALLDRMAAGRSAPDDTALVMARLLPPPLRLHPPADAERLAPLRRTVSTWCAQAGLGEDALTDLQLALGEAVTNAVEHAYRATTPGEVDIALDLQSDGSVIARVADTGRWRPPPADPGYRGRGLALIRELTQDVDVVPGEDGTVVRFRLPPVPLEQPPTLPGGVLGGPSGEDGDLAPGPTRLRRWADEHTVRLHIDGDLDLAGVATVRSELLDQLGQAQPITLTLAADCYVSSAGIALLSEVAQRARAAGNDLTVVTPSGSSARRILVLAGLDRVVTVLPVEEPGVA